MAISATCEQGLVWSIPQMGWASSMAIILGAIIILIIGWLMARWVSSVILRFCNNKQVYTVGVVP